MSGKAKACVALLIVSGGVAGLAASQVERAAGQLALVVLACLLGAGAGATVYRARR